MQKNTSKQTSKLQKHTKFQLQPTTNCTLKHPTRSLFKRFSKNTKPLSFPSLLAGFPSFLFVSFFAGTQHNFNADIFSCIGCFFL
jgi:hypothetical protein